MNQIREKGADRVSRRRDEVEGGDNESRQEEDFDESRRDEMR